MLPGLIVPLWNYYPHPHCKWRLDNGEGEFEPIQNFGISGNWNASRNVNELRISSAVAEMRSPPH